jgi:2-polyprenyl-3-methyl-5-hydroxy-6-metoxy-1,4-benzoquinol methylase
MEYYDENLQQSWSENDSFTKERYQQFCEYIKDGQTVLDIGCNTGRGGVTLKLNNPSLKIYGVELIKERTEKIPTGVYIEVFNESIIESNCNGVKFDVIVAGEVIEHIPSDLFIDMLHNCKNLLNEHGVILFTTPNPNSFLVKLGRRAVFNDPSHVNIMAISEFKKIVSSCGLQTKSIKGSGKVSRHLGYSFPMFFYGSYLSVLQKK